MNVLVLFRWINYNPDCPRLIFVRTRADNQTHIIMFLLIQLTFFVFVASPQNMVLIMLMCMYLLTCKITTAI